MHFEGRAMFKSPNLAYLDFSKIEMAPNAKGQMVPVINPKNNKRVTTRTETIVCGQNEVWQYLHEGRQIIIFPLAKGERQRALDEGPLPFLFNMKAKEAEERYEMTFMGENEKYYAVKVRPRFEADKETFKSAFIYLEKKFLLPERIVLVTPDARGTRDYTLELAKANEPINQAYFKGGSTRAGRSRRTPPRGSAQQGQAPGRPAGAAAMPRR